MIASPSPLRLRARRRGDGVVIPLAIASAVVVGVALARDFTLGIGLIVAAGYTAVALVNLPVALVLWVPMVFFDGVPAMNMLSKAVAAVLASACAGLLLVQPATRRRLTMHRRPLLLITGMLLWFTLSLLWAADPMRTLSGVWQWWAVGVLFAVVTVCVVTPAQLQLVVAAFVVGAVLSVGWSALHYGDTAARTPRLAAAAADPNSLAAGLVPAAVLAAVSLAIFVSPTIRVALVAAIGVLAIGLVATGSRGGLVAALVALVLAALVLAKRRAQVVAVMLVTVAFAASAFAVLPGAWGRATNVNDSGAGRTELWLIAWRIFEDHPIAGIGVNNFTLLSPRYVREPGALERVDRLAEDPKAVHNIYLEKLAETGLIGTGLMLAVFAVCAAAALRAARRFDAHGFPQHALLARGIALATAGMFTSMAFISASVDRRLWILCALGSAALAMSLRLERDRANDDLRRPPRGFGRGGPAGTPSA